MTGSTNVRGVTNYFEIPTFKMPTRQNAKATKCQLQNVTLNCLFKKQSGDG